MQKRKNKVHGTQFACIQSCKLDVWVRQWHRILTEKNAPKNGQVSRWLANTNIPGAVFGPLEASAIQKWALQYHIKTSLKCASMIPTARKDLQNPCCRFCWTPQSKERTDPVESDHEQGVLQCSKCTYTSGYHWNSLMQLGCYHNQDARPIRRMALSSLPGPLRGATGNSA